MRRMASKAVAALLGTLTVLGASHLQGCTIAAALRGEPGTDIGNLKPGLTRSAAEAVLGPPRREWTTPVNIRYRIYRYDAGVPASRSDAAAMTFLNVISLGLFELYEAAGVTDLSRPSQEDVRRVWRQIAIAYDAEDRIVGLFDDFGALDVLPDDGQPVRR